jgi:capsular polysaccharide transport system permease protein
MSSDLPTKSDVSRRAALLSKALAEAARRARFSTRTRRNFDAGGFSARRGARLMRALVWGSFFLLVALPTLVAGVYYVVFASHQYVANAQFTVMGGEVKSGGDALGAVSGIPAAAIIQDTQIVAAYLESRAAVEALNERVDLRQLYGQKSIDWFARFDQTEPIEQLVRYWRAMTKVSIKMPSGIVEFKVRAFSPRQAQDIARAVVAISEKLINDLNARMQKGAVASAEAELKRAATRLGTARARLEQARNEEGVLDTARTAEAIEKMAGEIRSATLAMQQRYQALSKTVGVESPPMKAMRARIDAGQAQIADLEAKLTVTRSGTEKALSATMTKFAALDLERQIAERIYAGSAGTLELARIVAESQLMYLKTFELPVLPEKATYPKGALVTFFILLGGLAIWGAFVALAMVARNNMA